MEGASIRCRIKGVTCCVEASACGELDRSGDLCTFMKLCSREHVSRSAAYLRRVDTETRTAKPWRDHRQDPLLFAR